jgi:hypothetical protein
MEFSVQPLGARQNVEFPLSARLEVAMAERWKRITRESVYYGLALGHSDYVLPDGGIGVSAALRRDADGRWSVHVWRGVEGWERYPHTYHNARSAKEWAAQALKETAQ